jgi:RNA polymerase sigma-70 factor (ECF subfamily)
VSAFDELVRRHRSSILALLRDLVGDGEDAFDLAQETFIEAFRGIRKFQGHGTFRVWLCRIAIARATKYLRRRRWGQLFQLPRLGRNGELEECPSDGETGDGALLRGELRQRLNEALAGLSVKHRTTVILAEVEEMTSEEIAATMGCSTGTVRSRLHYAKEKLKVALRRYLGESYGE